MKKRPRPTKRYRLHYQLARAWAIMRLLSESPAGLTAGQIHRELQANYCLRTIQRDLATLAEIGVVIEERRLKGEEHWDRRLQRHTVKKSYTYWYTMAPVVDVSEMFRSECIRSPRMESEQCQSF